MASMVYVRVRFCHDSRRLLQCTLYALSLGLCRGAKDGYREPTSYNEWSMLPPVWLVTL